MDTMSSMKAYEPRRQEAAASVRNQLPPPPFRRLRGYAFDPSYSLQLDTAISNSITFKVDWEDVELGPVGEYVEVVDYDPASGCFYRPVDLDDPALLAQDGIQPSEGNPQFHQQMAYAVAMTTIRNFEQAMGRAVLWSPRNTTPNSRSRAGRAGEYQIDELDDNQYVQRLRIYPHAIRQANAYYNPQKKALLFGYFPAADEVSGRGLPGGTVFACLSHDIIAHETTHAIVDGLHERFLEPSNPDVLAFHEAFADLVALFQHFTFPEVLRHQIARTRGNMREQNSLGELAGQVGTAIGKYAGLRNAIGQLNAKGEWEALKPDPNLMGNTDEAHERGAILVAAVFDAFISIYNARSADLQRIATNGTGVLPAGEIHPDLVNRFASEASKAAGQVLQMCIRALDYCPPFDITFGDFLRAIITADADLVPDDDLNYRVAFVEAFRKRGIYPQSVRSLSLDNLRWTDRSRGPRYFSGLGTIPNILPTVQSFRSRSDTYKTFLKLRINLHEFIRRNIIAAVAGMPLDATVRDGVTPQPWDIEAFQKVTGLRLVDPDAEGRHLGKELGLRSSTGREGREAEIINSDGRTAKIKLPDDVTLFMFNVHNVRYAQRVGPDGDRVNQIVFTLVQTTRKGHNPPFRGGCTLVLDLGSFELKYSVYKSITDNERYEEQKKYQSGSLVSSVRATYFSDMYSLQNSGLTFASLHNDF